MSTHRLVSALEANLQAELAGKAAQCSLLEQQEAAISAGDPDALDAAAAKLVGELNAGIDRARARVQLMAELATALGVDAGRIEPIAAALGADGLRLSSQRIELRAISAAALARGRRLAVLVRAHGALVEEALGQFLAPDPYGAPLGRGSLVDARA
jgi:hypothetical protein